MSKFGSLCPSLARCVLLLTLALLTTIALADTESVNGRQAGAVPGPAVSPPPVTTAIDPPAHDRDNGDRVFPINEDLLVRGKTCTGYDCPQDVMDFGFNTLVLMENNVQLLFDDTSGIQSYPRNDWGIIINDSWDGGADYFSIKDVTGDRTPFRIEAEAPENAFRLDQYGRLGLGIADPQVEIHIRDGDTPMVRLDQDGSYGWYPQVWDVAGNEQNFFIRDVTHGSLIPFRIDTNTPENTLVLTEGGDVGLGTRSPAVQLHLESTDPGIAMRVSGQSEYVFNALASGDLIIAGHLLESSSREVKENIQPVDSGEILAKVAELPVYEWNYKHDDPSQTHLGPVAEEFVARFGLGGDDKHISPSDMAGVALGAVKALELENRQLKDRLSAMEAALAKLMEEAE